MPPDRPGGRRLRFPTKIPIAESIPGAIARCARDHVLVRTRPILRAAGMELRHAGHCQFASPDDLTALEHVLRCPAGSLTRRAGVRVAAEEASRTVDVRFGDLITPLAHLELDRRRIAPASLAHRRCHRVDWMNLLLPYCPESLERLVDTCPACMSVLGWHYAWGLVTCEHCGDDVPASREDPLPAGLADDYRLFARLASPIDPVREDALAKLPEGLHAHDPGTLIRLAIQVGGTARDEPVSTMSRVAILDLPPPLMAEVCANGASMLRSWPDGFRSWARHRHEALASRPAELKALRTRLQRLAQKTREKDVPDIVATALPDLRRHAVHAFAGAGRYYIYKQVQGMLGLNNAQMALLRTRPDIGFQRTTGAAAHHRGRFDAADIDGIVPAFRGSVAGGRCAGALKLPSYAVEQCCRSGLLEEETNAVLAAVKSAGLIRQASVTALVVRLAEAASMTPVPPIAVSLTVASRAIGGRLKPWASIIEGLLGGEVTFWLSDTAPTTRSMRVLPDSLFRFADSVDESPRHAASENRTINQADAGEILNVKPLILPQIADGIGLRFVQGENALVASPDAVLEIARAIVWDAEIALNLGLPFREVEPLLAARGMNRLHRGWSRLQVQAEGLLEGHVGRRR